MKKKIKLGEQQSKWIKDTHDSHFKILIWNAPFLSSHPLSCLSPLKLPLSQKVWLPINPNFLRVSDIPFCANQFFYQSRLATPYLTYPESDPSIFTDINRIIKMSVIWWTTGFNIEIQYTEIILLAFILCFQTFVMFHIYYLVIITTTL